MISELPHDLPYAEFDKHLDDLNATNLRIMDPNSMGVLFASCSGDGDINTLFTKQGGFGRRVR